MVDANGKPFRTGSAFLKPLPVYNRLRSLQLIHPETDTLPSNELPLIELRLLVTFWLLLALLIGGTSAWWTVWLRFLQRGLDVNPYRQLRTAWIHPSEKLACGLAVLWTALHLWARFIPGTDMRPAEPTLFGLVQVIVLSGGTTMFLISLLLSRGWQFAADFPGLVSSLEATSSSQFPKANLSRSWSNLTSLAGQPPGAVSTKLTNVFATGLSASVM